MAKSPKMSRHQAALVIPFALWGVNYLTGTLWGHPILYCWLGNAAASLYYSWGMMVLYGIAIYLLWSIFKGRISDVVIAALIGMGLIEVPRLFVYLFKVGGNCG